MPNKCHRTQRHKPAPLASRPVLILLLFLSTLVGCVSGETSSGMDIIGDAGRESDCIPHAGFYIVNDDGENCLRERTSAICVPEGSIILLMNGCAEDSVTGTMYLLSEIPALLSEDSRWHVLSDEVACSVLWQTDLCGR